MAVDLYAHVNEITEQAARRTSRRLEARAGIVQTRVELTVRPCPVLGYRWVVVLDSDDLDLRGFANVKDAERYYARLVRDCEDDYARDGQHAWHTTDVPGVPLLPAP